MFTLKLAKILYFEEFQQKGGYLHLHNAILPYKMADDFTGKIFSITATPTYGIVLMKHFVWPRGSIDIDLFHLHPRGIYFWVARDSALSMAKLTYSFHY